jgi:hypothetical protein
MGLTAELGALGTATEAGAVERGQRIRQPRPLLSRVLGLLSGLMRTEKASA